MIKKAAALGTQEGLEKAEIAKFQEVPELFNARDWQLPNPVEDALKMSATRILPKEQLTPRLIMFGGRDHLQKPQQAFVEAVRKAGKQFDLKVFKGGGHSFMLQSVL